MGTAGTSSRSRDAVFQAIEEYVNASNWVESRRILREQQPALFDPQADRIFEEYVAAYRNQPDVVSALRLRRELVAIAEQRGIDATYDALITPAYANKMLATLMDEGIPLVERAHALLALLDLAAEPPGDRPLLTESQVAVIQSLRLPFGRLMSSEGVSLSDVGQRLMYLICACRLLQRNEDPEAWALAHENLGEAYRTIPFRVRGQNIERAIEHLQMALEVFSTIEDPASRGLTENSLGAAYMERIQGGRSENVEQAITHLEAALSWHSRKLHPARWVKTQFNLGSAYEMRMNGDPLTNSESAIAHLEAGFEEATFEIGSALYLQARLQLVDHHLNWQGDDRFSHLAAAQRYAELGIDEACEAGDEIEKAKFHTFAARAIVEQLRPEHDNTQSVIDDLEIALGLSTGTSAMPSNGRNEGGVANRYEYREHISEGNSLEEALRHFDVARSVFENHELAYWMVACYVGIALVLYEQARRGHSETLLEMAPHLEQALKALPADAPAHDVALVHLQLGHALSDLAAGNLGPHLDQAIEHYGAALSLLTRKENPDTWAAAHAALGRAYAERGSGNRGDNIEHAIDHLRQLLAVRSREDHPREWALAHLNLGNACVVHHGGNRLRNLEEAIGHFEDALWIFTRSDAPGDWAKTMNSYGVALSKRVAGEHADNIEQAIRRYDEALKVFTREQNAFMWGAVLHNLAIAYTIRVAGDKADNIESAIRAHEQSLEVRTRERMPFYWAMTQMSLGTAYKVRRYGDPSDNAAEAARHFRLAQEVYTRKDFPATWADAQLNSALLLADARDRVDFLEAALQVLTPQFDLERHARAKVELGRTLIKLDASDEAEHHLSRAVQLLSAEAQPLLRRDALGNLGSLYFERCEWRLALSHFEEAIALGDQTLFEAYTEVGRRAEVAQTAQLYAPAAYTLLKQGQAGEALVRLEQGKTRLLSQALALNEVDVSLLPADQQETVHRLRQCLRALETEMRMPPDTSARRDDHTLAGELQQARSDLNTAIKAIRATHPEFMPEGLELADILALIPEDVVLVAPVATSQGSAIFVVPAGRQSVSLEDVVWVDEFKDVDLQTLLRGPAKEAQWVGWLGAYFNARDDLQAWLDVIETTGKMLWDRLMGPIAERLSSLHAGHVLLMPQGGLGLLPLHAAWSEVDGLRSYFLDCYTVTYVTSAYAWHVSQKRLSDTQREAKTLLSVVNPTEDLPFTRAEGEQVASLFGDEQSTVLPASKATVDMVKQGLASYVHFACHGFYDWLNPMKSSIVLAKGERLTLAQIIGQLNLDASRLVTLSACETGITDIRQSPDEYLGLPAGFLRAGTPGVVSTLWAVADISTMLLMSQFFFYHLEGGFQPAKALCLAQLCLRNLTAQQLAEYFAERRRQGFSNQKLISAAWRRFETMDPEEQPFAHPYFWAPFVFTGV